MSRKNSEIKVIFPKKCKCGKLALFMVNITFFCAECLENIKEKHSEKEISDTGNYPGLVSPYLVENRKQGFQNFREFGKQEKFIVEFDVNAGEAWGDIIWPAIGATVAIGLALWLIVDDRTTLLLASLGGSTVFLFALTDAEAAQPRALFGGHLGGALIGILCYQLFGDALWVSVVAMVLTMMFMGQPELSIYQPVLTRYLWYTTMLISWRC